MSANSVTDLTRGVYRRMYAGFIKGQRINRLSIEAEAWFWRVVAVADDFGNADADPGLCYAATVGRRPGITTQQVAGWLDEMDASRLIQIYAVNGDKYLHIVGFEDLQPAGRNGKKVRRCPEFISSSIQNNPEIQNAPDSDSDSDPHSDSESAVAIAPAAAPKKDPNLNHPAVLLYRKMCHLTPNHEQRKMIVEAEVDCDVYEGVLRKFMQEGQPPNHVDWTLERYQQSAVELPDHNVSDPNYQAELERRWKEGSNGRRTA